jgi:hypothetical protein
MDQFQFVQVISQLRPNATFLTLDGYRNEHDEVANYSIVFNMSYSNALKRSIETLNALELSTDLEKQAKEELLASFNKSYLNDKNEAIEERTDAYRHFYDGDKIIRGVKMHVATGKLHLYGLVVHKRILTPGIYPVKNQRPLTIAKNKLRSCCSVGKFRQFIISADRVDSIRVEKLSLLPPE